jgi:hypothetical protein
MIDAARLCLGPGKEEQFQITDVLLAYTVGWRNDKLCKQLQDDKQPLP